MYFFKPSQCLFSYNLPIRTSFSSHRIKIILSLFLTHIIFLGLCLIRYVFFQMPINPLLPLERQHQISYLHLILLTLWKYVWPCLSPREEQKWVKNAILLFTSFIPIFLLSFCINYAVSVNWYSRYFRQIIEFTNFLSCFLLFFLQQWAVSLSKFSRVPADFMAYNFSL